MTLTPKRKKYTEHYWSTELDRSRTDRESFINSGDESISTYKGNTEKLPAVERKLNIWWQVVQTLLPVYFARVPNVEAELRKKSGDSRELTSALVAERATQYAIDEEMPFEAAGFSSVLQYLLVGEAVLWARYDFTEGESEYLHEMTRGDDGRLSYGDGTAYEGPEGDLEEEEGALRYRELINEKVSESAVLESVHYKDFRQSPARMLTEVDWKARRAWMSRDAVISKFGKKSADGVAFDAYPEDQMRKVGAGGDVYEGKAEFWEIWCRASGKVYWYSAGTKDKKKILESGDPPLDFKSFFPCSELYAYQEPNSIIALSDYHQCRDQIIEAERLTTRIHAVIQAIRTNFAYDSAMPELEGLLTGDLKGIPVRNWPRHRSRGGLSGGVEFAQIEPYLRALDTLTQAREVILQKIYQATRASDVIRGMTDPRETAAAQQLKSNYFSLLTSVRQRQVEKFFSDAIGRVGEIVCEHYESSKLFDITNGEELLKNIQPTDIEPEIATNPALIWESVVDLLRDDPRRRYRIEIASDSMKALDEQQEREERRDFMASTGSFLSQMEGFVTRYPAMAPMALNMMRYVSRAYKGGKELEDDLERTVGLISAQAEATQGQQQEGSADAQAKIQIAQIEQSGKEADRAQEAQKLQVDAELKSQELSVKLEQLGVERLKLQVELAKAQSESAVKAVEIEKDHERMRAELIKERLDTIQEIIKVQGAQPTGSARSPVESSEAKAPMVFNIGGGRKRVSQANGEWLIEPVDDLGVE